MELFSFPINSFMKWPVAATWTFPKFNRIILILKKKFLSSFEMDCHMQVHPSGNYIPAVISSPNYTSPPSTVATFLTTPLMEVLQPSGYSIFHSRDTPIQLGLPWWSYPYQCLNTETSTWDNKSFTTETLSISYTIHLYIRLVVTL